MTIIKFHFKHEFYYIVSEIYMPRNLDSLICNNNTSLRATIVVF